MLYIYIVINYTLAILYSNYVIKMLLMMKYIILLLKRT